MLRASNRGNIVITYDYESEGECVEGEQVTWTNVETEAPPSGEEIKIWIEESFGVQGVEITGISRSVAG